MSERERGGDVSERGKKRKGRKEKWTERIGKVDVCREKRSKDGGRRKRGKLGSVPTLYGLVPPCLLTLVFLRGW